MDNKSQQQSTTERGEPKYETGEPGSIGREGEFEEAHGNVYPASGPLPPGDARIESMASWGQGIRGAAGYDDTGPSELFAPGSLEQPTAPQAAGRRLGQSDLEVSPLMFGCNVFGWTVDQPTAFLLLDALVAAGFNSLDTADIYPRWVPGNQGGESETIIGNWFRGTGKRDRVMLATKVGMEMGPGRKGLSRGYIVRAVEDSLARLQTDTIDLYQAHVDDEQTPLEETLEAFAQLVKQGKVRFIGASNYKSPRLLQALEVSRSHGWPAYVSLQPLYNLYDRAEYESELEPVCRQHGLGVITYFSLASGFLTGKYRTREDLAKHKRGSRVEKYLNDRGLRILAALDQVADDLGATPAQIALAWLLTRPTVTAPIASATSPAQLDELLEATRLRLSPESIDLLDQASQY